jgi:phospholipid/cholesterol/gamma-HCH transport system substrate-binding protein
MTERTRNIAVGITLIFGLAGLAAMLLLFSQLGSAFERTYAVNVELPTADGLAGGSAVRMNGLNIGMVNWVQMLDPPSRGVIATAYIQRAYRVPADAAVNIERKNLLGGSGVLVFNLSGLSPEQMQRYLPDDGSATVRGCVRPAGSADPMQQIGRLSEHFEQLSAEWVQVGKNVNQLLEQRQPQAVDAGQSTANLSTMIQRIDQRLAQLQPVLDDLHLWTGDPELRRDVKAAAADTAAAMHTLSANIDPLMRQLLAASDNLSRTLQAYGDLADQARSGQGTLGQLVNNPALYNDLRDAAQRLQAVLAETHLLIQKWKSEGLPVQF